MPHIWEEQEGGGGDSSASSCFFPGELFVKELLWTLHLAKDNFASYAAQFQKAGERRWEAGIPAFSFHSPRVPDPSLLLLRVPSISSPNSFLPQTQGSRHPSLSFLELKSPSPSLFLHPLSHPL